MLPKPWPRGGPAATFPRFKTRPARKPCAPLATWRWLLWTQPAGTNGPGWKEKKKKKTREENEMKGGEKKQKKRRLRILMMLFLSPALSHWWNHMVPALTRDEFPQCRPPQYRQVLATSMDTPTYTHMHTTHDTTTHMRPCPHGMQTGCGRACPLKQTRELSVHETTKRGRGNPSVLKAVEVSSGLSGRSQCRVVDKAKGSDASSPSASTPMSLQPCPPNRMASPSAGSSNIPSISLL